VHHQRRTVFEEEGDQSVEKDCQFGCLNFSYKSGVVSPVTAYRNKWPSDWQQHWFYYTVNPPSSGGSHPLATKELPPLHESYAKNPLCPEGDEFVIMLRRFARKYGTRDIVEEYRSIPVCPFGGRLVRGRRRVGGRYRGYPPPRLDEGFWLYGRT
jgi:hypothetical protein